MISAPKPCCTGLLQAILVCAFLGMDCSRDPEQVVPLAPLGFDTPAIQLTREARRARVMLMDSTAVGLTERSGFVQSSLLFMEAERLLRGAERWDAEDSLLLGSILSGQARNLLYAAGQSTPNKDKLNTIELAMAVHRSLTFHVEEHIRRQALLGLAVDHDILEGYITHHFKDPRPSIPLEALRIKRQLGITGAELGRSLMNIGNDYWFRSGNKGSGPHDVDSARFFFEEGLKELEKDWMKDPWKYAEFVSGAHASLADLALSIGDEKALEDHLRHMLGVYRHQGPLPLTIQHLDGIDDELEVLRNGVSFTRLLKELYERTRDPQHQKLHDGFLELYDRFARKRLASSEAFGESGLWHVDWATRYEAAALVKLGSPSLPVDHERLLVLLDRMVNARLNKQLRMAQLLNDPVSRAMLDSVWFWRTAIQHTSPASRDTGQKAEFERSMQSMQRVEKMLAQFVDSLSVRDTASAWVARCVNEVRPGELRLIVHPRIAVIAIDERGVQVEPVPENDSLRFLLVEVTQALAQPDPLSSIMVDNARTLYRYMLGGRNMGAYRSITVVPYEEAAAFPFEALIPARSDSSTADQLRGLHFLGDEVTVRYELSPKRLCNEAQQLSEGERTRVFAPAYPGAGAVLDPGTFAMRAAPSSAKLRDALAPIDNGAEARLIGRAVEADLTVGQAATEADFKKFASRYGVLHVAAHGLSDPSDPALSGLVFTEAFTQGGSEDGVLHAYEVYPMTLDCDLVCLSACETGTGKPLEGEGTMSLARAFRSAGSRNVLMSLWKVDDRSTTEIMGSFYRHLAEGKGKASALAAAKHDFREAHPDAPPSLWAGFVLLGDDRPIRFTSGSRSVFFVVVIACAVLVTLALFLFLRSRTSQADGAFEVK